MTDFYSQNRCVCSTRSHGPLLCAFCLSFHFKEVEPQLGNTKKTQLSRYCDTSDFVSCMSCRVRESGNSITNYGNPVRQEIRKIIHTFHQCHYYVQVMQQNGIIIFQHGVITPL